MSAARSYITPVFAYVVVANPKTYELTRSILGNWVATQDGVAKTGGLILHAVVFILLTIFLMNLFRNVSYDRVKQEEMSYSKSEETSKVGGESMKKVFRPKWRWW
jgi:hypothetical protein